MKRPVILTLLALLAMHFLIGVVKAKGEEPKKTTPPQVAARQSKAATLKIKVLACGCRWYEQGDGSFRPEGVQVIGVPDEEHFLVLYTDSVGRVSKPKTVDKEEVHFSGCPVNFPQSGDFPLADESGAGRSPMGRPFRRN